jgi:hypothetical protein
MTKKSRISLRIRKLLISSRKCDRLRRPGATTAKSANVNLLLQAWLRQLRTG